MARGFALCFGNDEMVGPSSQPKTVLKEESTSKQTDKASQARQQLSQTLECPRKKNKAWKLFPKRRKGKETHTASPL